LPYVLLPFLNVNIALFIYILINPRFEFKLIREKPQ